MSIDNLIFSILLALCLSPGYAQESVVDSLENLITEVKVDTTTVNLLNKLALLSFDFSIPRSKAYATKALNLAREIGYPGGEALAAYRLSSILNAQGKLDSALSFIQQSQRQALELADSALFAKGLIEEGALQGKFDNDSLAIKHFFEALAIGKALKNDEICANSYSGLAIINTGLGYYNVAIDFLNQSLAAGEAANSAKLIAKACVNLAILHDSLTERKFYAEKALQVSSGRDNMNRERTYAYNTLGILHYYNLDQVDSALYFKKKGLKMAKASKDPALIQMISASIAEIYADVNLDSAAAYYEQLLQTTETHTYAHLHEKNLRELAKIRNHQGQTQEAYKLLDSSYTLVKERYYQNLEDKVAEANAKYEAEKKEAEIARQNLLISEEKNNRRIILITTGIVLVGLVLLGQYLINRQKRQRKETELALYIEQQRAKDMENLAQAKTDLFNNVSHELRTPLTMIIGPLEQALHQIKNIQLKSEVEMALHNSRRLTGLVNEILDLSKLDAGKMEVEMSEVKILTFIRRVFHAFRSLAGSQQIELIDNISENEWENLSVQTDFNKLEKIINNLVSNAIKYCKSDGQVSIHLQYEELKKGILNFSISDQGPGISKEDQAHIFDRYFQAAGNIQVSGTGIGLALTKELVQLLDGMVSVVSDGKNGSTFSVEIPVLVLDKDSIRKVEQASQPPTSPVEPRLTFSRNPRVLIVEDDLQMAKYLKSLLSEAYECTVAYNGKQAMELLQKSAYDLISSDIMMPEMDGFEFRRQINQNPGFKNTPFIMLSARDLEEDKLQGFQLGIDDYLTKPFSPTELKARIYNLIKNKFNRSELADNNITYEQHFLEKAIKIVEDHLDDSNFKVSDLAQKINYSSRQLGRVLKKLTGLSSVEFILELRLQKAYRLIKERKFGTINEVRYEVGIESASYFTTAFKERFGMNPSDMELN